MLISVASKHRLSPAASVQPYKFRIRHSGRIAFILFQRSTDIDSPLDTTCLSTSLFFMPELRKFKLTCVMSVSYKVRSDMYGSIYKCKKALSRWCFIKAGKGGVKDHSHITGRKDIPCRQNQNHPWGVTQNLLKRSSEVSRHSSSSFMNAGLWGDVATLWFHNTSATDTTGTHSCPSDDANGIELFVERVLLKYIEEINGCYIVSIMSFWIKHDMLLFI